MAGDRLFDYCVKVIPPNANFEGHLCRRTMSAIQKLLLSNQECWFDWTNYELRSLEPFPGSSISNPSHHRLPINRRDRPGPQHFKHRRSHT